MRSDYGTVLAPEEFDQGVTAARLAYSQHRDIQAVIALLRARGFAIIEAIRAVREIAGTDLADAKGRVHRSTAYADQRADHEAFHQRTRGWFRA